MRSRGNREAFRQLHRRWMRFCFAWTDLAGRGRCDAPDGAEFRRVWLEYADSYGADPYEFIEAAANRPPAVKEGG